MKKRKVLTVLERVQEHMEFHFAVDKHYSEAAFLETVYNHIKGLEDENRKLKEDKEKGDND